MKKLLYLLLLTPIIYLASCSSGKGELTPQTMEDVIVGKKWWYIAEEDGILLTEEGDLYYLQLCHQDSFLGTWIIDGDLIKLRYYENSIEYTRLFVEVTSYTDTELKLKAQTNDTNLLANYVFTTEFAEILGCTDATADNYNEDANCDDGSCSYCSNNCTYVPDDNFEQALINLGYDNVLDDYVLTANINTVTTLLLNDGSFTEFSHQLEGIDFTGIEGFTALENLSLDFSHFMGTAGPISLDLSNNTALTTLSLHYDLITSLDLSNNTALTTFFGSFTGLHSLDLSNNTALTDFTCCPCYALTSLDLSNGNNYNITTFNILDTPNLNCIEVDDSTWFSNNWSGATEPQHYFSEDCSSKK